MRIPSSSRFSPLSLLSVVLLLAALLMVLPAQTARAQDGTIHVVVAGDTLSEIAAAYGTDVETLRADNGITGNLIRIGQRLYVGGGTRPAAAAPSGGSRQSYVVKQGDNLSRIAQSFGVSVESILRVNQIANPRLIVPGQTLLIPPASAASGAGSPNVPTDGKWIDVDLSAQRVIAYEGAQVIRSFRVSTGLPETPTVTGTFRIRLKMPTQDMAGGSRAGGDSYLLKDVPWVQYFFEDYAFHGTTWHASFGHPASRGCINMAVADAKWLFDWAGPEYNPKGPLWQGPTAGNPGTLVIVHE